MPKSKLSQSIQGIHSPETQTREHISLVSESATSTSSGMEGQFELEQEQRIQRWPNYSNNCLVATAMFMLMPSARSGLDTNGTSKPISMAPLSSSCLQNPEFH